MDARLQRKVDHPIALALSGGGDSLALLEIAAGWAKGAGRRLLAITVDHGLSAESPAWSRRCRDAARSVGADWIECRWEGAKPITGLPAAARRARHAVIADEARRAGARVVLFGHTADDVAEGEWMRVRGSTLGRLREWSPSPAWPEGRGLMLFRPMLSERREALRALLRARGGDWIEDPSNRAFGRGRARAALQRLRPDDEDVASASAGELGSVDRPGCQIRKPLPLGEGFDDVAHLSQTLLCVSGRDRLPKGHRLRAMKARLGTGERFAATLAGARIEARGDRIRVLREPGEFRRRPPAPLRLDRDRPAVWDGRYEITTSEDGWSVVPSLGRLASLSPVDRAVIAQSPVAARGTLPVLIRDDDPRPVLAWRVAKVLGLAPRRLSLALGETTQEKDLTRAVHGETPPSDLF